MILMIDNYDSFTYNLVQYLGDLGQSTEVYRNDKITPQDIIDIAPDGIVISPGPGTPQSAGISMKAIKLASDHCIPLLGVCLGHQAIGAVFGGNIIQAPPVHGKASDITHDGDSIFKDLPNPTAVTRYHSLIIEKETCPEDLIVTAQTGNGIIMGVRHKDKPIHGVQFHPESIATQHGHKMLQTFVDML